ncbi:protein-glutamate O-methyltransferase CheR [Campylobacter sp. 19-13652]|uniref:CheR family methyltransferase n=1 Tax=Campylobacter sp. 19-13652 TaxID=2840180 RepID=UPI001C7861A8|nr:protein-glutamate O-methyltransferase CheR [Campylobacter sp. 19-13652]BCX79655.1 chemotaxis protein methyltransferase [Campylobacter sp. 19-13652]
MFFKKSKEIVQEATNNEVAPSDISGFNELMRYIKEFSGVDLEQKRDITMQRLSSFAKNNSISTYAMLLSRIKSNTELRQDILNLVTVNETYFYRELAQLKDVIAYAKSLGSARILCAPCSSGDEVYSIAMLAYEASLPNPLISITGIDINSEAIAQCNAGEYSPRSLHRLSEEQKKQFFENMGDKFLIKKSMLAKCEFKIINVFDDALFGLGKFDIVLSRNMMIYFDDDFRLKCIERLAKVLKSGGRLYAGHADLVPNSREYEKKFINGSSFYERV